MKHSAEHAGSPAERFSFRVIITFSRNLGLQSARNAVLKGAISSLLAPSC